MFEIGDVVVCIDDDNSYQQLIKDNLYVVRDIDSADGTVYLCGHSIGRYPQRFELSLKTKRIKKLKQIEKSNKRRKISRY